MREADRNCAARSRQRAIGVVNHERTSAAARDISKSRRKLGEGGGARRNGRGGGKGERDGDGEEGKAVVVEPEGIRRIGDPTRGFRCD